MKIFLLLILFTSTFAQEETEVTEEDKCAQELEQKCSEADGTYKCIMADPTNEKKKFTKECFPKFKQDLEAGKYSHPCLDEMKKACPNPNDKGCVRSRKASFSSECQDMISDQGIPQAPQQEELNKVSEACKAETTVSCDLIRIDMEIAQNKGKTSEAGIKLKQYVACMKGVLRKPKDENCSAAMKNYQEILKKESPAQPQEKGFQEIK